MSVQPAGVERLIAVAVVANTIGHRRFAWSAYVDFYVFPTGVSVAVVDFQFSLLREKYKEAGTFAAEKSIPAWLHWSPALPRRCMPLT